MYKIIESIQKYFRPYYLYILVFLIILVFLYGGYQAYLMYGKQVLENKKHQDVANVNNRKGQAEILFFYAEWCPHCKKAKPEWLAFQEKYDKKVINGNELSCKEVDCTDDADNDDSEIAANQALRDKFDIKGYPTIKLITEGEEGKNVIDFDSKITSKGLETFVQSILK